MTKRIPVLNRSGMVVAYALVDDVDYERLAKHRWRFGGGRYAARWGKPWETKQDVFLHHEVCPVPDGMQVDHRDRNTLNNTRANLRACTPAQNTQNCPPRPRRSGLKPRSKHKGVSMRKGTTRWRAQIKVEGQMIHLGYHASEESAARAYDAAARVYFGEFAYTNFPEVAQVA